MKRLSAQQSYSYLQAMGIKLWVPRLELPAAAPSQPCQWEVAASPTSSPTRSKAAALEKAGNSTTLAASAAPVAKAAALAAENAPATSKAAAVIASLSEAVTPPPPEVAPFTLHIWQLANSWQLIFSAPPSKQELQLLHNLLFAFHPQTLGILQQVSFSWPLPKLPSNGTKQEAAFSLLAFLTGANFAAQKPEGCMVFGQQLKELHPLLTKQKAEFFYLLPSLKDLLTQPQLKAQLWQEAATNGLLANFKGSWVS